MKTDQVLNTRYAQNKGWMQIARQVFASISFIKQDTIEICIAFKNNVK